MSALLAAVVLVLTLAAYQEVLRAAKLIATDRLHRASTELAELFRRSMATRITETTSLAADAGVRTFLATGGRGARAQALQAMRKVAPETATNTAVELLDDAGRSLLRIGDPTLPPGAGDPPARADSAVIGPLRVAADTLVYYDARATIAVAGRRLGQAVQVRRLTTSAQARQAISGLMGGDATVLLGNAGGELWTDLGTVIRPPPPEARRGGAVTDYRRDALARLGAATPIAGTPWLVIVELESDRVLAPARTYLRRMAVVALIVVVLGAAGAWAVSRGITTPLRRLTEAAEAVAAGGPAPQVAVGRPDELGRLAEAFNVMAERVARARRGLEAEVSEREARLSIITETAHDAIVSADDQGHIFYWNPGAARLFGYTADEVLGRSLTLLMPERFHAAHLAGFRRYLTTGTAHVVGRTVELEGRHKDGSEFPLELSLAAARTETGVSFTGIIRDITERKHMEMALRETNAELEAFTYSVSHDLRAPLRAIDGFTRILLEDHGANLDTEGRRVADVIRANTHRMGALIDDLLTFSRLGRTELVAADVDMQRLAGAVVEELQGAAGERSLEISLGTLPPARGDRPLLRQVLLNLIQNAVKFTRTRTPSRIELGARADGNETVYFVRDNGVGFDIRYAGKLFGVFQRLHRAEEFEGTGVGLAIVQRIVHRHGGRVWAEGAVDAGATFYFSLPREPSAT
ncbi:MAG: sensor histidine kinase [Gemmatimonadales bacterium]